MKRVRPLDGIDDFITEEDLRTFKKIAAWDEGRHPRDHGKFTTGPGSEVPMQEQITPIQEQAVPQEQAAPVPDSGMQYVDEDVYVFEDDWEGGADPTNMSNDEFYKAMEQLKDYLMEAGDKASPEEVELYRTYWSEMILRQDGHVESY